MPLSSVFGAQSLIRPGVCTSTTRPAVPFEGQFIYESDTDTIRFYNGAEWIVAYKDQIIGVALSDETTNLTTGVNKATIRSPFSMKIIGVRASLNTASSSGTPTVDINVNGTSIFSTTLTVDANELTSVTAAVPAVIANPVVADDATITFDIDVAGTGSKGLKVWMYCTRS